MRRVVVSGKTVEEAVFEALRQLRIGRDRAEVVVKTAPSRGFFGIGARAAQVEVTVMEDPVGDVERFLREMFVAMGIAVKLTSRRDGDEVTFRLEGDKVGLLIGKHGQTLDAIQNLASAVGNKYVDKHLHFYVDAEGYRERRKQALISTARKMADKAVALKREIPLSPMGAQERKIVHLALEGHDGVRTESRGSEPDRAIVIIPTDLARRSGRGARVSGLEDRGRLRDRPRREVTGSPANG